ncbi:hypothetical protein O3G_MSEX011792 [Manduca sexta]|uniref:Serpin domain-containing protein n=1 Tax=Manduca sexta TaxID=7130 RepID=A0A921ZNJ4_MANSE|nr:hypothetical protein O3G_MSEX011792 [Manduca sexta]KAG6460142.1 hypothetical protein O3G_MSEX011792 [Manduca sexta]
MRKILLILACAATIIQLASAYSKKDKDCKCHDSDTEIGQRSRYADIIHEIQSSLFNYFYKKYPNKSVSVTGSSVLSILTQLALHKPRGADYEKLLQILHVKNIEEAKALARLIVNIINKDKNQSQKYEVYADRTQLYTRIFLNNFKEVCDGEARYLNYKNNVEAESNINDWYSPPENKDHGIRSRCYRRNGLIFKTTLNMSIDFSHPNNPSGRALVDYYVDSNTVVKIPSLHGNARVLYYKDTELNIEYVGIYYNNHGAVLLLGMPNDTKDLPRVVEIFTNKEKKDKIIRSLKLICVELTTILGAVHMKNNLVPYLLGQGFNPNGYYNVFTRSTANVNAYVQHINIVVSEIQQRASIHSPMCPIGKCLPKVRLNKPMAYCAIQDELSLALGTFVIERKGEYV